jgi:hypothetical protein
MTTHDIDHLSFAELAALRDAVDQRMKDMRETGIVQLRATIAEQAQLLGVTLKDLLPKGKRRGRPRREDAA